MTVFGIYVGVTFLAMIFGSYCHSIKTEKDIIAILIFALLWPIMFPITIGMWLRGDR